MTTETVDPQSQNSDATYPGTRYGKGGTSPSAAAGDHSEECKVVDQTPGVG
jgi:hypothetical protein